MLTPLAFDPGHPFPLISNLSKNFAVVVRHGGRTKFARVKVPDVLPRFIPIPESLSPSKGLTFVFLEDVIRANIHELFPGHAGQGRRTCSGSSATPISRSSRPRPTTCSRPSRRSLKQLRHGAIALLQVGADMPARVLNILVENFGIDRRRRRADAAIGSASATGCS